VIALVVVAVIVLGRRKKREILNNYPLEPRAEILVMRWEEAIPMWDDGLPPELRYYIGIDQASDCNWYLEIVNDPSSDLSQLIRKIYCPFI
jgi:hypothetical protein